MNGGNFEIEQTGEEVEGITIIVVDGVLKQFLDINRKDLNQLDLI